MSDISSPDGSIDTTYKTIMAAIVVNIDAKI